ncbi:autoinducer binding domain-containing protein [Pseudomonas sp. KNUC1026]|uniref:autoinducer binding domain-containing protein n=1 Tax=Pseudomonas sp. KNUC1026 TaxID=2893890 RepID=UPI001F457ACA|nr:autoinducer binding domain-containing protein [Pseudomonas sp. KNUC1026]UFH50208.1 autoinducer binding domain-containing protein [Pseudomonas sp. KNUC1026]
MNNWQSDILTVLDGCASEEHVFQAVASSVCALGFEWAAFGIESPSMQAEPQIAMINNYPEKWQAHYHARRYLAADPTVANARNSQALSVWSNHGFAACPQLWEDAQAFDLRVGVAQSCFGEYSKSLLTLARSREEFTLAERESKRANIRWLVSTAHMYISRYYRNNQADACRHQLTKREVEVLKWTGVGRTSPEISALLFISENTVNYHIKNAVAKLKVENKTAAAVILAMWGVFC